MTWIARNPATGDAIGQLDETPPTHAPTLFAKARQAFGSWSRLSLESRIEHLTRLRLTLMDLADEIAEVISISTGKMKTEALTTEVLVVADAISHVERHAKTALRTRRVKTPITFFGKSSYVEFKPRGVVLAISPWNFPFQLAMVPVIEALATGNAVILKPSEITPLVGVVMEKLFTQAQFPPEIVQIAHGGKDLGAALIKEKPDFIHFTGSVRTGKIIQAEAAKELIPTTLELGGKDPMIVFADANLERAANGAVWGAFCNSGQVCMSVERLYVQRSVYDAFLRLLAQKTAELKQGTGDKNDIGSMTFPPQIQIVRDQVAEALSKGAKLLTGDPPDQWQKHSMFLHPMILTDVAQDMAIMQEETFGPVLPVIPFDTEEEAVRLANDSRFGLSSSVWTADLDRARRCVSQLYTGNSLINDVFTTIANPYLPYGGVKEGGIGAYHAEVGVQNFSIRTAVMVDRGKRAREVNWFPYAGKYALFSSLIRSFWGERKDLVTFLRSYLALLSGGTKESD